MRHVRLLLSLLVVLVLCGAAPGGSASATAPLAPVSPPVVASQLLIGFRPEVDGATRAAIVARHGGRTIRHLGASGVEVVEMPPTRAFGAVASDYDAEDGVRYVEPNAIYRPFATPDDPRYLDGSLWNLDAIGAPAAWETTTGSAGVVVGILDSGVDYAHPDLAANVWTAPAGWNVMGCGPGTHGYRAVGGITSCDPLDDLGHGTSVAGIVGAAGNNGIGVVGVNWHVSLMPLKFIGANGIGTTSDAVAAIEYAIAAKQAGVNLRVLNASWGSTLFSQSLLDAITRAGAEGILVVAAAGDGGTNLDTSPIYPASYGAAPSYATNVIAVTSIDKQQVVDGSWNYGPKSVHLVAPGGAQASAPASPGIWSTTLVSAGSYNVFRGTSMAAAHVAGAAALILAATGVSSLAISELKARLLYCGDPLPGGEFKTITGRRLNIARAIVDFDCATTPTYRLTLLTEPAIGGAIVASPAGSPYLADTPVTLTATAAPGYRFTGWRVDTYAAGSANPLTVAMVKERTVVASFELVGYALGLDATAGGQVTATPGDPPYLPGAVVTLSATPDAGYLFAGWTIDGVAVGGDNPFALTMDGNHTARATFVPIPGAGTTYSLTLTTTTGGAATALPPGPYAAGAKVALTATPAPGYVFTGWTIDGLPGGRTSPYTLTMTGNRAVVATFTAAALLNLSATAGGSVTVGAGDWPGGSPYPAGTPLTLTATTNSNQVFTGWTIDGVFWGWPTPLTLTMETSHTVVANFASRPRFTDLPAGPPPYEAISQLGARQIVHGYANGDYGPYGTTLRAQMAALIVRAMGWDAESYATPFNDRNDVDDGLWRSIGTLAHYGVAQGYGDGSYGTLDPVLAVQVISFIARAMVTKGYWAQQPDDPALCPNVPVESGHRPDLATYIHYAGPIPGTAPVAPWDGWSLPATRGWFAEALWQALDRHFGVDRVP